MAKVMKSSSKAFVSGGKGKMFGKQAAGPMSPGVTGKVNKGDGGKWGKGGSGKMFGKQSASPRVPGRTGK
jgi:hypothetical protein